MAFIPRKRFGQHFLIDNFIIEKIIDVFNIQDNDHCLEIGPGQGALTFPLLKYHPTLMALEIDHDLIQQLKQKTINYPEFTLYTGDALKFDFSLLPSPLRIIGNLPYNISTPLLFHLLNYKNHIGDMVFMLQKEVVERLVAKPFTKAYGRLTIMIQYDFEVSYLFDVPPDAFSPPPKVESAVLILKPRRPSVVVKNYFSFSELVKTVFQYRRKTLRNILKTYLPHINADMLDFGIDLQRRPETLSVEEFVELSNFLEENK